VISRLLVFYPIAIDGQQNALIATNIN